MDAQRTRVEALAAEVADTLGEREPVIRQRLLRIVRFVGEERTQAFLDRTLAIESAGGMLLPDGSRRRTPGGVFFTLVKQTCSDEEQAILFPLRTRRVSREPEPPLLPAQRELVTEMAAGLGLEPGAYGVQEVLPRLVRQVDATLARAMLAETAARASGGAALRADGTPRTPWGIFGDVVRERLPRNQCARMGLGSDVVPPPTSEMWKLTAAKLKPSAPARAPVVAMPTPVAPAGRVAPPLAAPAKAAASRPLRETAPPPHAANLETILASLL